MAILSGTKAKTQQGLSENRTKIRLKLTPEARNALGGDEFVTLDLAPKFSFRLSKSVEELTDINEINTEGVLPFSVPFSKNNDFALLPFTSPAIVDNPVDGIEARAETDGYQLLFDKVYFRQKNDSTRQWDLEFRRSPDHWLELASNKMLCTIECGTATVDVTTITDSWLNHTWEAPESPVTWCIQDYGGWVDLAEPIQFTDPSVKQVWLEDFRPNFSLPYLLKQGVCEIGWNLQGLVLETEWFRSLWVYILSREYFTESRGGTCKIVGAGLTTDYAPLSLVGAPLIFDSIEYDLGANAVAVTGAPGFYFAGLQNPLPYKSEWKFCFSGTLENTSASTQTLYFRVIEFDPATALPTGNIISGQSAFAVELAASETRYVNFCMEVQLEVGQYATLYVEYSDTVVIKAGYRINVEPNQQSLVRGDTVTLNRLISCEEDYTLLNLLKGVCHLLNARLETDFDTRTLTIYPERTTDVYGDPTPGFVDESALIDIDGKIICDSAKIVPLKNTLTRFTRLQFAESTDAYISELDPLEPPHSRKVLNGIDLPDRVTELENPFFEPTLEGQNDSLKRLEGGGIVSPTPFLARLWDNTDGQRSFNIRPRIFFHYGAVAQLSASGQVAQIYFEGANITEFGYLTQVRKQDWFTSPAPHLDGNAVFGTLPQDLYVIFYLGAMVAKRRGSLMDILVWMDAADYKNWNFRNPFYFNYEGVPVKGLPQSVRDFAPAADLPTPVTMLIEPLMTDCCDLPCSCRFTECEYFQDFGQYMSQATLDSLSVTSFVVNQNERLSAPIEFGIINVAEINGKPFVTNLVDALNSAGVEYFSFSPGESDYAGKDDLRFFKIKRPACWSFVIEISDAGGVVYQYTDTSMGTAWFSGGDLEPFGYEEAPVSEPQNCTFSVEY